MSTLIIWHGSNKPMVAVGKNQCHILGFAEKYKGWHSSGGYTRPMREAIKRLAEKGYLEIKGKEYQFTYPKEDRT